MMDVHRPRFHFTPAKNWINDPNGLIYHDGLYHLYFQHNPEGIEWGNMSWGHATSTDLSSWAERAVALRNDATEAVYSGSVVCDDANVSGLAPKGQAPLLAFYTSARPGSQSQAIAASTDGGFTWTRHGVVLDRGTSDFRDPKVIRYGSQWILLAVEARDRQVHFFTSEDLLQWAPLSVFGPHGAPDGIWECPDLFPVDDRWVLTLSINPGHPSGGSGMQYFVGDFDGREFTATSWGWLDHGHDFYAGVTFEGVCTPLMIGWMSNWAYAGSIPTSPWRGVMSIPRRLAIEGDVLTAQPVLPDGFTPSFVASEVVIDSAPFVLPPSATDTSMRIRAHLDRDAGFIELAMLSDGTAASYVRYGHRELAVDRSRSGDRRFAGEMDPVSRAAVGDGPQRLEVEIVVDECTVEVFADGGRVCISELVFPPQGATTVSVSGDVGERIHLLEVSLLERREHPAGH